MAEAHANTNAEKARRRLGGKKLEELHATSRMGRTWNLDEPEICRGAALRNAADDAKAYVGKAIQDRSYSKAPAQPQIPKASPKDLGLMQLTSKINDPVKLIKEVRETIANLKNCDLTAVEYYVYGAKYINCCSVEYLVGCFKVGEELKIEMKRMCGGGFEMAHFYSELKSELEQRDVVYKSEEDSESEFVDYDESEDESGEADDGLDHNYLQLRYDRKIVGLWLSKIEHRSQEDQLHMAGLLAYNASNKENLTIIVEEGREKLKDMIRTKLENSRNVALVRFTALLAQHVTTHEECKKHGYDEKRWLESIFDAVQYWVPKLPQYRTTLSANQHQSTKFDVTESRETVGSLIETIYNIGEKMKISSYENLVKIAKARLVDKKKRDSNATYKEMIDQYLKKQEQTNSVKYFRHILDAADSE